MTTDDVNRITIGDDITIGVCPSSRAVVTSAEDGVITYKTMGPIGYWLWKLKVEVGRTWRRLTLLTSSCIHRDGSA